MTRSEGFRLISDCGTLSPYKVACSSENRLYFIRELSGDFSGVEPPVPIPNTEVKCSSADDTRGETLRENMSLPGSFHFSY